MQHGTHEMGTWLKFAKLGGEKAQFVERVLDVRQGELCWVVGTVYMEMALKPNVLDDISKEVRTRDHELDACLLTAPSTGSPLRPPARRTCLPRTRTR